MSVDVVTGGALGALFTVLSHPLHVLYTLHTHDVLKGKTHPCKWKFALKHLRRPASVFKRGLALRTLQGCASYTFLFFLHDLLQPKLGSAFMTNAASGFIENIVVRQPLLTATTATITSGSMFNPAAWERAARHLPITCLLRSGYFGCSSIGSPVLGLFCGIQFVALAEVLTNTASTPAKLGTALKHGLLSVTNPFLVGREALFLVPFFIKNRTAAASAGAREEK